MIELDFEAYWSDQYDELADILRFEEPPVQQIDNIETYTKDLRETYFTYLHTDNERIQYYNSILKSLLIEISKESKASL